MHVHKGTLRFQQTTGSCCIVHVSMDTQPPVCMNVQWGSNGYLAVCVYVREQDQGILLPQQCCLAWTARTAVCVAYSSVTKDGLRQMSDLWS